MATGSTPSLPVRAVRSVARTWQRLRRGFLRTRRVRAARARRRRRSSSRFGTTRFPQWVPPASVVVVILIGGFTLSPRSLVLLLLVVAGELAWLIGHDGLPSVRQGNLHRGRDDGDRRAAASRARAPGWACRGCAGSRCSSTCATGCARRASCPSCRRTGRPTWCCDPAGGASFSGDFLVAGAGIDERMEIVLVDVSGKGVDAGTRALLLSGAFGGLLGATPSEEFLVRGERLPRPPGLGRGLRHRRARGDRPAHGRLPRRVGGPPAGGALHRGLGDVAAARRAGDRAGHRPRGDVRHEHGRTSVTATRCCSTPTAWSSGPAATSPWASTGCSARRSGWCRAGSGAARAGCSTRCARARATTAPSS